MISLLISLLVLLLILAVVSLICDRLGLDSVVKTCAILLVLIVALMKLLS